MLVVHVITGLSTGGAEMTLLKLVQSASRGFRHHVISLGDRGTIGPRIEEAGCKVEAMNVPRGSIAPHAALRLSRLVEEQNPSVVQSWMYHANLAVAAISPMRSKRWPMSWSIRGSIGKFGDEKFLTEMVIRAGALCSWLPDRIIYNSTNARSQHEAIGYLAARGSVISNGFDIASLAARSELRAEARAKLGVRSSEIVIGNLARLHPMKDHSNFIRAAEIVAAKCPSAKFICAGPNVPNCGSVFPELRRIIEGLGDRVVLLPEVRDVAAFLGALDVFVISSAWGEAFPNALGEAMACGLPSVVTDVGDCSYIVGDAGITVPPRRPDLLASAIISLVCDGQTRARMSRVAKKRVANEFSLTKSAALYEAEWDRLASWHGLSR